LSSPRVGGSSNVCWVFLVFVSLEEKCTLTAIRGEMWVINQCWRAAHYTLHTHTHTYAAAL